ncbi:hypothetical protein GQ43DRAFT_438755 [Delitschia confertaspora ATCC 74209]|uniref:SH3 domain protein n=1 Tax=Delitschia confertaspora ATCC 74209 TaxID=1513339 RepID=A0A9P4JSB7_9PLEO|nr:hypothetical protein GQ43DRAFT_438755 [Delitschia confertaspora ATCC 74209]
MQRVQRKFGTFMKRTPNDADIESMLKDFTDSDQMLAKIEEAAKQWRDAWSNILSHQVVAAEQFHAIYKPLAAKGEGFNSRVPVDTPQATLERAAELSAAFTELKTDMMEDVKEIDKKLIIPAKLARDALKPMKKTIKAREDKKLDYERYKSRCEALQKKAERSDRENNALAKHEADLARATHDYQYVDEGLRTQLPRLNAATFSLLPHLLANQIVLQNNLIGNLYTVFHQYSQDHGYPNPPPELEEVIPVWDATFTPLRTEVEGSLDLLKSGKAIHQPMRLPDKGSTLTGLGLRNRVIPGRQTSSQTESSLPTVKATSPRPGYTPSPPAYSVNEPPALNLASKPSLASLNASKPRMGATSPGLTPNWGSDLQRTTTGSSTGSNGNRDYFSSSRIPSAASSTMTSPNPAAGKKKPPPPPPKKIGSFHGEIVTAMYDFDGLNAGDLTFREGDRIRVLKKTNSTQDWWEGEFQGVKGSFPANYCK